ncbi:unnamed protein product, partial [Heligmosomoides polygyrus]|uniref:Endo/exonuclease/phosphatase domain-containing protein n=1 Tax=Heligmosomoides polygyrus TaxID=6339 RepID=A0A183GVX5_HELPZ
MTLKPGECEKYARVPDARTASGGSRRALAEPGECEKYARVPDARTASGGSELVRKSRNVGKTRVATLNVGTLTGRSCELAEALERRRIDLCGVQETRWSCCKSRDIGRGFKAILCGSPRTTTGVGVIVSERFRDAIMSVERFNDRLMKVVVAAEQRMYHFFCAYAPQAGCYEGAKDEFWTLLDEKTAKVPSEDAVVIAGDLNGHVGTAKDGRSCHGGFGYGARNTDGERILEYADSHNLI